MNEDDLEDFKDTIYNFSFSLFTGLIVTRVSPLDLEANERVRLSFTKGGDKDILAALGIRWDG